MLRRARMGNRAKQTFSTDPRAGVLEEDVVMDDAEKPQPVDEDRSYTVRKWMPTRVEKPDAKYLADRRPGLPPLYGVASYNEVVQPAKKVVKVRKTDPETGQQRIYDAMILEGGENAVDGEIITEEEAAAAIAAPNVTAETGESAAPPAVSETLAPGTVIEGLGVVNEEGVVVAPAVTAAQQAVAEATPVRRRPPPPKRKKHGPGRGRKKKVMFAPGEGAEVPVGGASTTQQPAPTDRQTQTKAAGDDASTPMNLDGPGEGREDSNLAEEGEGEGDEEDDEDEEGSEEGEIEEDGDEGQIEEGTQEGVAPVETDAAEEIPQPEIPTEQTSSNVEEPAAAVLEAPAAETIQPPEEPLLTTTVPEPAEIQPPTAEAEATIADTTITEEIIPPEQEAEPSPTSAAPPAPPALTPLPVEEPAADQPNPPVAEEALPPTEEIPFPQKKDSVVSEMDLLGSLEKTLDDEGDAGEGDGDEATTGAVAADVDTTKDATVEEIASVPTPPAAEAVADVDAAAPDVVGESAEEEVKDGDEGEEKKIDE